MVAYPGHYGIQTVESEQQYCVLQKCIGQKKGILELANVLNMKLGVLNVGIYLF